MVPTSFRRSVFDALHSLSHSGPKPSTRAITLRFVWPGLKRDVRTWCRECHPCQAAKISRHIKAPLQSFDSPSRRFGSLHLDLVGPLPPSEGMIYLLTIVDRFSLWPTAIPIPDATAATCCQALLRHWFSYFGIPDEIITDRGTQFTGSVWEEFLRHFGIKSNHTTSYHPQANGLVERMHRQLKGALKARLESQSWMNDLPWVLLGLRSAWRESSGSSPAEAVFGTLLRLPGEFVPGAEVAPGSSSSDFVQGLQRSMSNLAPMPEDHHGSVGSFIPASISKASHVYVRVDARRSPLQKPYDGPYKVLEKSDKFFSILKNGKPSNVSIDRLKPAFLTGDVKEVDKEQVASKKPGKDNVDIQYSDLFEHNDFPPLTTRYGRLSKRPVRFQS